MMAFIVSGICDLFDGGGTADEANWKPEALSVLRLIRSCDMITLRLFRLCSSYDPAVLGAANIILVVLMAGVNVWHFKSRLAKHDEDRALCFIGLPDFSAFFPRPYLVCQWLVSVSLLAAAGFVSLLLTFLFVYTAVSAK